MSRYSNSSISNFQSCPLKFRYRNLLHLQPVEGDNNDLIFGRAMHKALESIYTDGDLKKAQQVLRDSYPVEDPNDLAKTLNNGLYTLKAYTDFYNWDPNWKVISCEDMDATEDDFVLKLDLVIEDTQNGGIYGVDHKFTKNKLDYKFFSKFNPNSQVTQYVRYIKEKYGACDGFIINAVQLSWLQEKDKAGRSNAKLFNITDPNRLTYSNRSVGYSKYYKKEMCYAWGLQIFFERQIITRTQQQIDQEQQSKNYWIARIEEAKASGIWGMNTGQCFLCEFQSACGAGWDWEHDESLIKNLFRQVCDTWIPEKQAHCSNDLDHDGPHSSAIQQASPVEFEVE